ncbi:MAG: hypothetical protein JXA41_07845 [Deltaproteobacteria bacterium]|nr:hypothetical protein [Deltaproteobacteria bacterium]
MKKDRTELFQAVFLPKPFAKRVKKFFIFPIILLLTACSPSLYSIHVKYEPSKDTAKPSVAPLEQVVTVAAFNDARPEGDDLLIGHVIKSRGRRIPVIPKKNKLSQAVSESIKNYLRQTGYAVSDNAPTWDSKEDTLRKEWGRIVVGGNIDQVELICKDDIPIKRYHAEVKLTVFFADTQKGKIFYTVSATGKTSLEHIRFSEEILGQQFNGALSATIEDIFRGDAVRSKIRDIIGHVP